MIAAIAIGETRTAYLIERNITDGKIVDFQDYADYSILQYMRIIEDYILLGGEHLILSVYSWQLLVEQGAKYAELSVNALNMLTSPTMKQFYIEHNIQPRFVGLEILQMNSNKVLREVADNFENHEKEYDYSPDKHQLIWEIATMPLLTYGQNTTPQRITDDIANLDGDIANLHDDLYNHYAKIAYKIDIPPPDIYIGSAENGDLKIRSMSPMAFSAEQATKFYFLKYPSILITKQHLKLIMDDAEQATYMKTDDDDEMMNEATLNQLKSRYQKAMNNSESIRGISSEHES